MKKFLELQERIKVTDNGPIDEKAILLLPISLKELKQSHRKILSSITNPKSSGQLISKPFSSLYI